MKINLEYQRAVWNLATETLPAAGWGDFRKMPDFPDRSEPDVKLDFLNRYLKHALGPQDIRANPNLRHEHMRGDLNKYHPWLLRAVLRHLYETHIEHIRSAIRLPEDLKKVIDDLHLFHKRYREVAERTGDIRKGSIQHYKTLDEFHKTMDMLRPPPSPLKPDERDRAFAAHLQEHGGDGGATVLATLKNDTMVIQLNTEAASISLGSPHWCTAYRSGKTWFSHYKDNLIMIVASDGRRHQLHFRKKQFMDANDNPANLREILAYNEGLVEALSPILKKVINPNAQVGPLELRDYLEMCEGIPEFEDELIQAHLGQRALKYAIERNNPEHIPHVIHLCLKNKRFADALAGPKGICQALNISTYASAGATSRLLSAAAENDQLAEALASPEGIASALKRIAERVPGKILHDDYRNFRKACQAHPVFLRALASSDGFPHLIREASRSGNKSRLKSLKDEFENLKQMATTAGLNQTCPTSGSRSAAACLPAHVLQSMA